MMPAAVVAPLKWRYVFKVAGNLGNLLLNLVAQAIVPRSLGPGGYGQYNFLTTFFTQTIGFLDMGTSMGFLTKLSRNPQEKSLNAFYFSFMLMVGCLIFLFIAVARALGLVGTLWPDQGMTWILLAAGVSYLLWCVQVFFGMADAYGLTVSAEKVRLGQRVLFVLLLAGLFWLRRLDLLAYFGVMYVSSLLLIGGLLWMMRREGAALPSSLRVPWMTFKAYLTAFFTFSHPLFWVSIIAFVTTVLDRWLLQRFAGSVQQGFFGFSYQVQTICFLFSSAMTPLLMREFSIAFQHRDVALMGKLFRRFVPLIYSVAAFFSCFIAVEARSIVGLFGGAAFDGAILPMQIMVFLPMYAAYGHLSTALFMATDQTSTYSRIACVFLCLGVPATFLFVAPVSSGGLGLGAMGLAAKMLVFQILTINAQLLSNARFLQLAFGKYLAHQIGSPLVFLLVAFGARAGVAHALSGVSTLVSFLVSGAVYVVACGGVLILCPLVFGVHRADVHKVLHGLRGVAGDSPSRGTDR